MNFFSESKKLKPITGTDLLLTCAYVRPAAAANVGGELYLPLVPAEVVEWLHETQIDRMVWREHITSHDAPECVCRTFSTLLWALVEQERLRCGAAYSFAFARVTLFGHSLCGFIGDDGGLRLVEPQTDEIIPAVTYAAQYPGRDIQRFEFV